MCVRERRQRERFREKERGWGRERLGEDGGGEGGHCRRHQSQGRACRLSLSPLQRAQNRGGRFGATISAQNHPIKSLSKQSCCSEQPRPSGWVSWQGCPPGWGRGWEGGVRGQQLDPGPPRRASSTPLPSLTHLGRLPWATLGMHPPGRNRATSGTVSTGRWVHPGGSHLSPGGSRVVKQVRHWAVMLQQSPATCTLSF